MKKIQTIVMVLCVLCVPVAAMADDLTLMWDPQAGATHFKIQASDNMTITNGTVSKVTWGETRFTPGNQNTFVWTGAPSARMVLFRVAACNETDCATNYTKGCWYNSSFLPPNAASGLSAN